MVGGYIYIYIYANFLSYSRYYLVYTVYTRTALRDHFFQVTNFPTNHVLHP